MSEKSEIEKAYAALKKKVDRIDILVHNAGCMINEKEYNLDKIEKNFATNTFSVYYFTLLCLDLLHPQSKTIFVSSGGCLTEPLEVEDLFMEK